MKKPKAIPGFLLTMFLLFNGAAGAQEKSVQQLKTKRVEYGFEKDRIEQVFSDPRFKIYHDLPSIWSRAKKIDYIERGFCSDESIEDGLKFFISNSKSLLKAWKEYEVGGEYITALLKMESNLGRKTGERPVLNSIASNWFYIDGSTEKGKKRERIFYEEIAELLKMEGVLYEDDSEIFSLKGSYGGAFGWPQAIPTSYKNLGVDFDMDGDIDISDPHDPDDSIGFIANYLVEHDFKENKFDAIQEYNPNDGEKFPKAIIAYADKLRERFIEYIKPYLLRITF
ncbi:MAG: lytic murein transglycosylase [Candidatus Aenigmatarchaeota archaeon]|nr:MAG: lytic murein transglycosylase [Candidatus Aenigmarchaeota archaeon]